MIWDMWYAWVQGFIGDTPPRGPRGRACPRWGFSGRGARGQGDAESPQCTRCAAGHLDDYPPKERIHFSSRSALFGVSQYEVKHALSFPHQVSCVRGKSARPSRSRGTFHLKDINISFIAGTFAYLLDNGLFATISAHNYNAKQVNWRRGGADGCSNTITTQVLLCIGWECSSTGYFYLTGFLYWR